MNSKGVTLIEVIIYAVLLVIVSMIIGSQVKTMLKSYTGGQRVSSIQGGSRDVLAMLAREIRNTGFKRTLTPGTSAGTW
ncbi:MAG TPA: prepilin-type N-terminal cleavage/methylation domain-containing protein, partial [Chitinispirillaceae bacterium]|nr:prepilin-type N-terminal cleavage/methylation domain-containing protein [Chitinispirillaceae bacterium]